MWSVLASVQCENVSGEEVLSFLSETWYPFETGAPELHPAPKVCVHRRW